MFPFRSQVEVINFLLEQDPSASSQTNKQAFLLIKNLCASQIQYPTTLPACDPTTAGGLPKFHSSHEQASLITPRDDKKERKKKS